MFSNLSPSLQYLIMLEIIVGFMFAVISIYYCFRYKSLLPLTIIPISISITPAFFGVCFGFYYLFKWLGLL